MKTIHYLLITQMIITTNRKKLAVCWIYFLLRNGEGLFSLINLQIHKKVDDSTSTCEKTDEMWTDLSTVQILSLIEGITCNSFHFILWYFPMDWRQPEYPNTTILHCRRRLQISPLLSSPHLSFLVLSKVMRKVINRSVREYLKKKNLITSNIIFDKKYPQWTFFHLL